MLLLITLLTFTVWGSPAFPDHTQPVGDQSALDWPECSLETILTYSQEHNPTLQAARERVRAASEQPAQAAALDDPMFTYEGFNIPENFDLTRTDNNYPQTVAEVSVSGQATVTSGDRFS